MAIKIQNHPELVRWFEHYDGIERFVRGSVEAVVDFIIPYVTEEKGAEGAAALANRKRRLYVPIKIGKFLSTHSGHLAQKIAPENLPTNETFKEIDRNVDRFGTSALKFARDNLWYRMRDGRVGILVDRDQQVSETKEGATQNKERSYRVRYEATQIRYWRRFYSGARAGQLREVVLDEPSITIGADTFARLRRYTIDETGPFRCEILQAKDAKGLAPNDKSEAEFDVILPMEGTLERIPFVLWGCGPEESFLWDCWEQAKALLNLCSVMGSINHNQGFQRVVVFGGNPDDFKKAGENLMTVTPDDKGHIEVIQAGDPTSLERQEARLKNECERNGLFETRQLSDDTRQVQSADSKREDRKARLKIYGDIIDEQEAAEKECWQLHAMFEGESAPEKITVRIERDFGLDDEEMTELELTTLDTQAQRLGAEEVCKAVLRTRVAKARLAPKQAQKPEDLQKELMDDIDAAQPNQGTALTSSKSDIGAAFQ